MNKSTIPRIGACLAFLLCLTALHTVPVQAGAMWRAFFDDNLAGIPGTTIDELVAASDFDRFGGPFFPELLEDHLSNISLDGFNSDDGIDNFGSLTHGYIQAPMDGDYVLVVGSDDNSELYLGEDHEIFDLRDPDRLIGFESNWTNGNIWTAARFDERSGSVALERGKTYFIEILHNEGTGGSFIEVAWQRPDGVRETIPGVAMLPYGTSVDHTVEATSIEVTVPPVNLTAVEKTRAVFYATVFAPQPTTFQWLENGSPIDGANLAWLELDPDLADDGNQYSVRITDGNGATVTTSAGTLTVEPDSTAPELLSAMGSGDPKGILVQFSEGVDTATATNPSNYSISGQDITINGASLVGDSAVILDVSEYTAEEMTLSVSGVRDRSSNGNLIAAGSSVPVALQSGLFLYLAMDDAGGSSTAVDTMGNYDGAVEGATFVNDPDRGQVASFDGDDDYINLGPVDELLDTDSFSLVLWFNREADDSGDSTNHNVENVLVAHSANAGNDDFEIGTVGSSINGYFDTAASDTTLPAISVGVQNNTWHHLTFTYDAAAETELHIYFDGEQVFESIQWGGNVDGAPATPWTIGIARIDNELWAEFQGMMDDLAFYDYAISPDMAAALAAGSANPLNVGGAVVGPIEITSQPQDTLTSQLIGATFNVEVTGTDPTFVGYQWYRDGNPIPGATQSSWTISRPTEANDDGARIHVEVFNQNGAFNRVASDTVTLTVVDDPNPPAVSNIRGLSGGIDRVEITFDEPVTPATAADISNYSIDGLTIDSIDIDASEMIVTLHTSAVPDDTELTVNIDGVSDRAGNSASLSESFTTFNSYPDQVLEDDPVRYWRFNESSGTDMLNVATFGIDDPTLRDGTYNATVALGAAGLIPNQPDDTAASFDSVVASEIAVLNGSDLNAAAGPWTDKSFEVWIQPTALPAVGSTGLAATKGIFEQGGGDRAIGMYIWRGPNDTDPNQAQIVFFAHNRLADGNGTPWFDPATAPPIAAAPIQIGQVYHIVGVMDGDELTLAPPFAGTLTLYVNGEQASQASGVGLINNHTGDIQIGQGNMRIHDNSSGDMGYFDGIMDDMSWYNTVLSSERVRAHFEAGFAGAVEFGAAEITSHPESASALEGEEVSFTIEFTGTPPVSVDWTVDGASAAASSFTENSSTLTLTASGDNNGAAIQATVSNDEGSDASDEAVLTVELETDPPQIVSASATGGDVNTIALRFNEALDPATAADAGNYNVSGLNVSSAVLSADGTTVTLTTDQQTLGDSYNVTVNGVADASATGNVLNGGTAMAVSTFTYADAVLKDAPDMYLKLGEGAGNLVAVNEIDSNWNGIYNAVAVNGALPALEVERLVVGSTDPAIATNPLDENRVQVPDSNLLNTGGPYEERTLELWFNATSAPADGQKAVLFEEGGLTRGMSIYLEGTGSDAAAELYFNAWNDNADASASPWGGPEEEDKAPIYVSTTVNVGETYHIVLVMQGDPDTDGDLVLNGTLSGYVNGEEVGSVSGVGLMFGHGDDSALGGTWTNVVFIDINFGNPSGATFHGVLDEFAVYNTVLSAERIAYHYEVGTTEVPFEGPTVPAISTGGDVMLTIESLGGGQIQVRWDPDEGILQSAPSVEGPWTDAGSTNPWTGSADQQAAFYRVAQ